jgi:hypothetical protein
MLAQGKAKEEEFKKFFKKVFDAYVQQDMKEHWDFGVRFDVKMIKSVRRHQQKDENIHWVELKNVNGEKGWLYGEADFFSFELEDYWVIVSRDDLQGFIEKKCVEKIWSKTPKLYSLYQRDGRKDIITLVKSIDLMYISTSIKNK